MADSTQFQIDIDVPSGGTSAAADAVERLRTQLEAAGAASTAAAEAVRAGEAAYSQAEKAASRAAAAVEKIGLKADEQRGKLAAALDSGDASGADRAAAAIDKLTQRQAEMSAKAEASKAALAGEAAALDKLRAAAASAESAEAELSKAHKGASEASKASDAAAKKAAENFGKTNEIAEGLGKLGGPAGQAGQKIFGLAEGFNKLGKSLGAAGPYVALAVAIIAITTAAIAGTIAIAAWAVQLSDAANTQTRLYQGMVQSAKGGEELEAAVNGIATRVPLTNEKLRSMASELAKTGLRGKELESALDDAAAKASEAQFGPEWAKQINSLDKQSELFKSHITQLFRLKTDALQAGLARIIGLFDETSTTGKAIKVVFDSLMQPLIDGLTSLIPIIVKTFIQFEIWALRALIAIKPYGSTIAAVAKGIAILAGVIIGVLVVALVAAVAVGAAFLTIVTTVWRVIIAWGETLVSTGQKIWEFEASIVDGAGSAFTWLIGKVTSTIAWLGSLSLSEIGTNLIQGLATGILGGGPAIFDAISGVVGGAIDGAKKLLGIASPSRVFAEIGAHTAAGMAKGVDSGASDVQGSIDALVAPPTNAAAALPGGGGGASSTTNAGGNTFNINVNGGGDAKGIAAAIRAEIQAYFDGAVDQIGAGEPA